MNFAFVWCWNFVICLTWYCNENFCSYMHPSSCETLASYPGRSLKTAWVRGSCVQLPVTAGLSLPLFCLAPWTMCLSMAEVKYIGTCNENWLLLFSVYSYNTMLELPTIFNKIELECTVIGQRWQGTNYPVAMHTLIKYLFVCMHVLVKTVGCEWHTRGQGGTLAASYPGNTASISAGIQTAALSLSHERLLAQHETHSLQSLTWRRIKNQHKGWLHAWVL